MISTLAMTQIKAYNMKNCFLILIFALFNFPLRGQEGACGTQITEAQVNLESLINIVQSKAYESIQQLNVELAVTVYIIKDQDGNTGITLPAIQAAIDKLNVTFSPVKLKFRICNTNYVDNYQFNTINAISNQRDLVIQNNSTNTINLYFASTVVDSNGAGVAGYTLMPAELKDAIFIDKDFIAGNDIIHQFGHFFNLYHTHETVFGNELVTDVNCNKTGDHCCDTPADPNISGSIDGICDYKGTAQDADKQFYVPATNNYMSLGNGSCRCVFTNDQLNRVIYSVLNQKKHLW